MLEGVTLVGGCRNCDGFTILVGAAASNGATRRRVGTNADCMGDGRGGLHFLEGGRQGVVGGSVEGVVGFGRHDRAVFCPAFELVALTCNSQDGYARTVRVSSIAAGGAALGSFDGDGMGHWFGRDGEVKPIYSRTQIGVFCVDRL